MEGIIRKNITAESMSTENMTVENITTENMVDENITIKGNSAGNIPILPRTTTHKIGNTAYIVSNNPNEKYIVMVIMQKTFVENHITKGKSSTTASFRATSQKTHTLP